MHSLIDPAQNHKKIKTNSIKILCKKIIKFITKKMFVVEHSAWRQIKENYQIYLPYQFPMRKWKLYQKVKD